MASPPIKRAFPFSPFIGVDGSILMHNGHVATEAEVDRWMCRNDVEAELDRLALEMCACERKAGVRLEPWQLEAEMSAFKRIRVRAA
jgi:hypothetical protein